MDSVRDASKPLSPLFRMAVLSGVCTALHLHIRRGENVNATDAEGRTPLILAAMRDHTDICQILLEAGADPCIKDKNGNDALQIAVAQRNESLAHILALKMVLAEDEQLNPSPPDTTDERILPAGPELVQGAEFLVSEWEEETEPVRPQGDTERLRAAATLQQEISFHLPIDTDEDWADVEIDLPNAIPVLESIRADVREPLRELFAAGLREGSLPLQVLLTTMTLSEEEAEIDDFARLEIVLSDLGIETDERQHPDAMPSIPDDDETSCWETAAEALAFFDQLAAPVADPFNLYAKEMRKYSLLTRSDEEEIGAMVEASIRQACLCGCSLANCDCGTPARLHCHRSGG